MKAKHLSVIYYLDPALRIVELAFHRQGPGNTLRKSWPAAVYALLSNMTSAGCPSAVVPGAFGR